MALISRVDSWVRCDSERTSSATTAKPRPASPRPPDGGIQREQVGLLGDAPITSTTRSICCACWRSLSASAAAVSPRARGELAHAGSGLLAALVALFGNRQGLAGILRGQLAVLRHALRGGRHLRGGGGDLADLLLLLLTAPRARRARH